MRMMLSPEMVEELALKVAMEVYQKFGLKLKVVETLPEVGEPLTLYFVPNATPQNPNNYDEYVWIVTDEKYELIGQTSIDTSNFALLDGNNTFSGSNAFATTPIVKELKAVYDVNNPSDRTSLSFTNDNGYNAKIRFGSYGFIFTANMVGSTLNGQTDFGSSQYKWRDIYLSRNLTDGTNSVSVSDLANLIAYAKAQGWIS